MVTRGIEVVSYFQVDNPLVKPFDPLFLGLHAATGSEMSTKVAAKMDDLERVGNVCMQDGRVKVIEYSDLPESLAHARTADGGRMFDWGNLAIHLLDVAFIDRIIARRFELPYHRAEKPAVFLDDAGLRQTAQTANSLRLETFVFDALPLAENPLVFEVERSEEFSPVKNEKGVDSLETAVRDQTRRAANWVDAAGGEVPRKPDREPDLKLEIAPTFALDKEDLRQHLPHLPVLRPGEAAYIS
jgi:UDP-N-acetylglucosamine/UDP-N-acetylgalactosamine diphosphorylase